jgi:hypothetical protein
MAGRLTRFLNLEKRRPERDEPAREVATPGRFTPLEQPAGAQPAEGHPVVTQGRFDPPKLSLDRAEHAFARCPSCGGDAGGFDVRCVNCGTRLDTAAARAFNEQLSARRQAEAEAAQAVEVAHQKELAADQRALGEAIAQEVAGREQTRLGGGPPLGVRWLARLPDERRTQAVAGLISLFAASILTVILAGGHPRLRLLGIGLAVVLLSLFTRRRRF